MSHVSLPGNIMMWLHRLVSQPFLDMQLFIDPTSRQVEWKPYRKPLNHLERIPWVSHHPLDIKRRTFIGELSRLAVLSSKIVFYQDAIRELKLLYISRGYPVNMVNKWARDQAAQQWQQRLEDSVQDVGDLFVLKSTFNPLWVDFDVKDLFLTIKKSWVENYPSIVKCDLVGRCSLHNSSTMQHTIPFDIRVLEKKRLNAAEFKYSLVNPQILADTQMPVSRPAQTDFQQYELVRFWERAPDSAVGSSRKRQSSDDGGQPRLVKVKWTSDLPGKSYASWEPPSPVRADFPAVEPAVDVSISCLSTNPSLPRRESPQGPYLWTVGWTFSEKFGVVFEQKLAYDFFKTSFLNCRMLVSRKCTHNLFDLAAAWQKARNRIASEAAGPDTTFDNWS
jgi:hypothetical protein